MLHILSPSYIFTIDNLTDSYMFGASGTLSFLSKSVIYKNKHDRIKNVRDTINQDLIAWCIFEIHS